MSTYVVDAGRKCYFDSLDYKELLGKVDDCLKAYKSGKYIEYKDELIEVIYKGGIKAYLIKYIECGLDDEDFERLHHTCENIKKRPQKEKYQNIEALANRILNIASSIQTLLEDVAVLSSTLHEKIKKEDVEPEALKVEIYKAFKDKKERLSKIDLDKVFPLEGGLEVKFIPSVKEKIFDGVENKENKLMALVDEYERDINLRFLTSLSSQFNHDKYDLKYMPLLEMNREEANVFVLHSPFIDEFRLFTYSYFTELANGFIYLDVNNLKEAKNEDIMRFFMILSNNKYNLIVENIDSINKRSIDCFYKQLLDLGKKGLKVFIYDDTSSDDLYNRFIDIIKASKSSYKILDISKIYLSMPIFDELIERFVREGLCESVTCEDSMFVKENMQLIGFYGMNDIVKNHKSEWKDYGRKLSFLNKSSRVTEYIENLPNLSLFIDSSWSPKFKVLTKPTGERKQYDYDALKGLNRNNLEKIMTLNSNMYARVGLLIDYCLLHLEDYSIWQQLSTKEIEERATLAVKGIYILYGIDIEPVVEIHNIIDGNPYIGGQCVGGGKKILFKKECTKDYDYFTQCIAHETFHSLQAKAVNSSYSDWYRHEFGITKYRIEMWRENGAEYISIGSNQEDSKAYRHQIYEADAQAFQRECFAQYPKYKLQIDFE